jgi:hypothetical protein
MATRRKGPDPLDHTETLHESIHRLSELVAVEQGLLDRLADTHLAVTECLATAKRTLCSDCQSHLEAELPISIDWSRLDLPPTWTAAGAYRDYRERLDIAIAEVAETEEDAK